MKSRMSCCNGALLRRDLSRTALLWGAYLLIWLVGMPGNLLSASEWETVLRLKQTVLRNAANACHAVSFFYALAVAWFLFLYLHRSRSANFFGALPLCRKTMFLTHYLAGILCSIVPNFLIMGATMVAGAACGCSLVMESAIWFAANTLGYVFYFSLAVLCTMLVGNLIAMPSLYTIVNFVAVVVEAVGKILVQALLYGFSFTGSLKLSALSPFYHAVAEGRGPDCISKYAEGNLISVRFEGWSNLLILAAVGIALSVIAFFLHKYRRMEVAGDVMAIKPLKPVFLYVFTFGCALVGGTLLAQMLVDEMYSHNYLFIAVCVAVCTVAGYFLGEMILLRTLRVFRKRNILRCAICLFVVIAALTCIRLDVLGVEGYVPDAADVTGVKLDHARHAVENPERIQQVIDLHEEILARKTETEALCRQEVWSPQLEIAYVMKDGREVVRNYKIPVRENEPSDPHSLIYKYDQINNSTEMILARELPRQEVTANSIYNCEIDYYMPSLKSSERIDPTAADAYRLWTEAMLPDFKAGNMGTTHYSPAPTKEAAVSETYSDVSVVLELKDGEGTEYYHYNIPATAVHTMAALIEMGVPAEAFVIPLE